MHYGCMDILEFLIAECDIPQNNDRAFHDAPVRIRELCFANYV